MGACNVALGHGYRRLRPNSGGSGVGRGRWGEEGLTGARFVAGDGAERRSAVARGGACRWSSAPVEGAAPVIPRRHREVEGVRVELLGAWLVVARPGDRRSPWASMEGGSSACARAAGGLYSRPAPRLCVVVSAQRYTLVRRLALAGVRAEDWRRTAGVDG
jgi:hypothetical protein